MAKFLKNLIIVYQCIGIKNSKRNIRKDKSSQWESESSSEDEKEMKAKRGRIEEEDEEDEWYAMEKEREKDLLERDALNERIKKKDKEKTRKIVEKSDKKVFSLSLSPPSLSLLFFQGYEEAMKRLQVAEKDQKKLVSWPNVLLS